MRVVIFGLTVSSSWGNGHATLWRSLIKSMLRRGHTVTFFERDVPFYARARDLNELPPGGSLCLYREFSEVRASATHACDGADLALCTSYCPDGQVASDTILQSRATLKAFYDMDTPVTLQALDARQPVPYLPPEGLGAFDAVFSFTGGRALSELESRLGARRAVPLYGSVDPDQHHPTAPRAEWRAALSYLGTYAADRQHAVQELFFRPAQLRAADRFLMGGAQYAPDLALPANVRLIEHVAPPDHSAFFCSSRATLNVTRGVMASYGFCPAGRLFEAAACGAPLLSDAWDGLSTFFEPGKELFVVRSSADVLDALSLSDRELGQQAQAARQRALQEHTGDCRVRELERICDQVYRSAAHVA